LENETGSGVADFHDREVVLDDEGRTTVEAPAGTFMLSVGTTKSFTPPTDDAGLRAEREITIESGRTVPAEMTIETGGRLRATVRDAAGEVTTPGRRLRILDEAGERLPIGFWGKTDKGWSMPPRMAGPAWLGAALPPGNYTVVLIDDGEEIARREVAIVRGQTAEVEFRLRD
jgi:hypothetical protein